MKKGKLNLCLYLIVVCYVLFFSQIKVCAAEQKKHLLILNSYSQGYKWTDDILKGINQSLKGGREKLFIDTEYMDAKRRYDSEYFHKLYELYEYKYRDRKFDAIICTDNDALNFLLKYGQELFPNTPVVFCGINNFNEELIKNSELYTGILENVDYKKTIDCALKINPKINKIVVLSDKTTTGAQNAQLVKSLTSEYKNINITLCDYMDINHVENEISQLKNNSIVLIMATGEEIYGKYIPVQEFAKIVVGKSPVPVYSLWDSDLENGVLGGMVTSGFNQGKVAGKLAKKILSGKKPSELAIVKKNTNKYMFDYSAMNRYGIKASDLPEKSTIINKPSVGYNVPKIYVFYGLVILIIVLFIVNYILVVNISRREKSEKLLRESEEQYRRLFELCPDSILVDKGGIIKLANKASLKLFGVNDYEQLIGKRLIDFVPKSYYKDFIQSRIFIKNKEYNGVLKEGKIIREDGTMTCIESSNTFFPYKGENMILTVKRDITDRKRLLEALEHDKIKTEFFSNISHELRTPLNVILSAIQLWELYEKNQGNSIVTVKKYKYINIMKQNCFRLLRLINNLIDITKIDSNYLKANFKNHNIINLVEDITLSVADYIENKDLNLIFDTEIEEKIIACDPDKIERIILNLLSNAVKFTNPGDSIYVNIYDRNSSIIISVRDTGIGIPKDKLEIIFERFKQVDKSLSRNKEGSGIGLSLVKSFVEMHSGSLAVKSEYGKGSEFIVELPTKCIPKNNSVVDYEETKKESYVERINIEFSDIYE